jgi:MFS family permease
MTTPDLLRRGIDASRSRPAALVLAVVCVAQFMVVLDVSIVNVALPNMQRELGMSQNGLGWVLNAYTLTFAGFLLLGGRAADLWGRRPPVPDGRGAVQPHLAHRRPGPSRR